jgi:hypothetical protein
VWRAAWGQSMKSFTAVKRCSMISAEYVVCVVLPDGYQALLPRSVWSMIYTVYPWLRKYVAHPAPPSGLTNQFCRQLSTWVFSIEILRAYGSSLRLAMDEDQGIWLTGFLRDQFLNIHLVDEQMTRSRVDIVASNIEVLACSKCF